MNHIIIEKRERIETNVTNLSEKWLPEERTEEHMGDFKGIHGEQMFLERGSERREKPDCT